MAVYTPLSHDDIVAYIAQYDVGALVDFHGIAEGVTNTNYRVVAGGQNYILTLFENYFELAELPYFMALMQWWQGHGIACPQPIPMRDGRTLGALKERPATLVSFLDGQGVEPRKITPEHLSMLGDLVARMHVEGMNFPHRRANGLSVAGWEKLVDEVEARADEIEPGLRALICEEYNYLSEHWPSDLPSGPVHADSFPDNVFFEKPFGGKLRLSGVIDFYYACHDFWAYDLAIVVCAWCFDERHRLTKERVQALMQSYNALRAMTAEEEAVFPLLLRGAALRFLLTRTQAWLNHPKDALVTAKDPLEYAAKLRFFQDFKL